MTASVGCWMTGSGTVSTDTDRLPCQVSALMVVLPRVGWCESGGGAGGTAFGDVGQPAQRLDVAPLERQASQRLGDEQARPGRRVLLDDDLGVATRRAQVDLHVDLARRPAPPTQGEIMGRP